MENNILNKKIEKCWKCGTILTDSNISNVVYTSNPPKYTCINCEYKGKGKGTL